MLAIRTIVAATLSAASIAAFAGADHMVIAMPQLPTVIEPQEIGRAHV